MTRNGTRRWFGGLFIVVLMLGIADASAATDPAKPVAVSAAEAKQVRAVIEAQLKALAADDAELAFSLAAPRIRAMFGTPDNFIEMVRTGYPVVYRPASVAFLMPERDAQSIVQGVHLTDADGTLWLALYHLERQPDKRWRISGCEVARAEGRVA
jgi:hypothetical protein